MENGINFLSKPSHYEILRKLFIILKAEDYLWCIGDSDIYILPSLENILTKGEYCGQEILEALNQKIFYVFSEFYAFKSSKDILPNTYKEYLESDCKIAIFIVDCDCFSVYVKDDSLFDSIKKYVSELDCIRSEILDSETACFHFGI